MILSTIVLGFNACSIAMENKSKYEKELEEMQHNCFMKMKFAAQKELERYRSATEEERKRFVEQNLHDICASIQHRIVSILINKLKKAAKETGYDFNGVHIPQNEYDNYSIAYSQFVVPLVKAVQEQQTIIEKQQQQIDELKQMILASNITAANVELGDDKNIVLNQNVPNPFAQQTTIAYSVPQNAGSAQMVFYGMDGRAMKTVQLAKGKNKLNVFASDLSSGSYTYSLIVDGKLIDTKKLVKQ